MHLIGLLAQLIDISVIWDWGCRVTIRSATTLLALVASACGGDQSRQPEALRRDSAGVTIVESIEPTWSPADRWSVDPAPLLHLAPFDGTDSTYLLDPASATLGPGGRVVVADGQDVGWHEVFVFDSSGTLQARFGGQGEGPGEFSQLWWASDYRGDSILTFDITRDRLSIFDPRGNYARSVQIPRLPEPTRVRGTSGLAAGSYGSFGDGDFLVYPHGTTAVAGDGLARLSHLLLRTDPDGETWDSLGVFPVTQFAWDGRQQTQLWYAPWVSVAVADTGFWVGPGESFEISHFAGSGALTRIVRRSYEPRPVGASERTMMIDWFLEMVGGSGENTPEVMQRYEQQFADAQFAEFVAPYSKVLTDPSGNLWVEEFRWFDTQRSPIPGPIVWSVFDSEGVWLGQIEAPAGLAITSVANDRVAGVVRNDLGVAHVQVHRLHKP